MKKKTLLTALILGTMAVPSVFAYDDVDGVLYNIKDPNIGTYVERQPDGTTTSKLVLRKELMGVEGIRLVADNDPASSFRDSGYIGGSSVIMRTVDTSAPDTKEYARMESGSVDLVRHENGQDVYTTRVSYGGFTNTNRENKKIDIMHGAINISDYSNDAHDHDITLGLDHGLYQGDMTERNGSRLTKDKLTISKINGEEEYDDYGNDITKKFTADYDLNGMTVANEHGNIKFTTSGINAGNQKIEGVATGVADTDAVNVKQLNDKIGALKDNDTITTVTAGDNAVVTSTGHEYKVAVSKTLTDMTSATFGSGDARNVIDKGGVRVFDGSVNTGVTSNGMVIENTDTLEQASYTGSGMQASDDNATVRFTTTNIDAGNQIVHGVKAGVADTDAVNVKQLKDFMSSNDKDTITTVVAGNNMAVTNNGHEYTVSLDQATAKKIDDTAKGVTDNAAAIKTNADNIVINTANIVKAKSTVSAGTGVTVTETANANGSANYEVAIDQSTMDKINAATDGISGLNGKVGENAKAIDGLKSDVVKAKTTVTAGNGVVVNETTNANGSTNYEVVVSKSVTDQIAANTNGINGLNGKVGENAKAIDGLNGKVVDNTKAIANNADAIKANKDNIGLNKAAIDKLADRVVNNTNALNNKINDVQKESRRGVASASALAALHPLDYNPDHKVDVMAGLGHYRGKTAAAIGAAYRPNENVMFTIGTSINGKDTAINAGVSYKVGAKDSTYRSQSQVNQEIDDLKAMVTKLHEENSELKAIIYNTQGK